MSILFPYVNVLHENIHNTHRKIDHPGKPYKLYYTRLGDCFFESKACITTSIGKIYILFDDINSRLTRIMTLLCVQQIHVSILCYAHFPVLYLNKTISKVIFVNSVLWSLLIMSRIRRQLLWLQPHHWLFLLPPIYFHCHSTILKKIGSSFSHLRLNFCTSYAHTFIRHIQNTNTRKIKYIFESLIERVGFIFRIMDSMDLRQSYLLYEPNNWANSDLKQYWCDFLFKTWSTLSIKNSFDGMSSLTST